MEEIILFSTGCGNCIALEKKLKASNIQFEKVTDEIIMEEKGFMSVPMLEVNGVTMNFTQSNTWIKERVAQ